MPEFNPLSSDLRELDRKVLLISASAGTGKTWMITHIAARWLLDSDHHDPAALLMVTFTKAAALELKSRLRQTVVEVRDILVGAQDPTDEWTRSLRDEVQTPPEERQRLSRRINEVLSHLDDVNARTIHSFAAMLGEHGSSSVTSGDEIYERAVNEAVTRAALSDLDRLRMMVTDPEVDTDTVGLTGAKLKERVLRTARSAVGLGGLDPSRGAPSKAKAVLPPAGDPGFDSSRFLLDLVEEVERRAREIMRLEAAVTFDAMISGAYADAMSDAGGITKSLREGFGLVLIDEFQDTDGAQWAIFEEAFVGHVPLVLVGDPKQAIYSFRGGDVVIFQKLLGAAERGAEGLLTHELQSNYRSRPKLLGHLDALFMAAEVPSIREYFSQIPTRRGDGLARGWGYSSLLSSMPNDLGHIPYVPIKASLVGDGGRLEVRDLTNTVPLLNCSASRGRPAELPYEQPPRDVSSADDVRELLTEDVVATVKTKLVPGRDPKDICILVRTNTFADALCEALRKAGITAVTARTTQVYASRAALQLRCLLWVLVESSNARRNGLLSSTWFRHHDPEGLGFMAKALEEFGPGALCRRILDTSTTREILNSEDPERNWTDIDHLFELLGREYPRGVTPAVALSWLESLMTAKVEDEAGRDAAARRVESDGGAVTVMTSHSAKGLEFPVVLIPSIESWPGGKDHAKQDGVLSTPEGRVFDFGRLASLEISDDSPASRDEELQRTDEAARLIYVSLTRAAEELVVWITDLDRHDYAGDERSSISKTSLWRVLLESLLVATDEELEVMSARCGALGMPFDPAIEVVRPELAPPGTASLVGQSKLVISTDRIEEPPEIDERLRRWSYSALHVQGTAPALGEIDVETEDGATTFEGGAFAEDVSEEDSSFSALGSTLFGGYAGSIVGNAIHQVYERVVGVFTSEHTERLGREVSDSYRKAGLALDDTAEVASQFAATLSYDLGEQFGSLSLDGLTSSPGVTTANEMRFTLPLEGRGGIDDNLVAIASFVAKAQPTGPYATFFADLANRGEQSCRLLQGFLTGSIDLVAQVGTDEPRFVVLDYKSNLLKDAAHYSSDELIGEMSRSGYPLQGLLYSVALHRYLARRMKDYDASSHFGGICYFYVRAAALDGARAGDGLARWEIPAHVVTGVSEILAGRGES